MQVDPRVAGSPICGRGSIQVAPAGGRRSSPLHPRAGKNLFRAASEVAGSLPRNKYTVPKVRYRKAVHVVWFRSKRSRAGPKHRQAQHQLQSCIKQPKQWGSDSIICPQVSFTASVPGLIAPNHTTVASIPQTPVSTLVKQRLRQMLHRLCRRCHRTSASKSPTNTGKRNISRSNGSYMNMGTAPCNAQQVQCFSRKSHALHFYLRCAVLQREGFNSRNHSINT